MKKLAILALMSAASLASSVFAAGLSDSSIPMFWVDQSSQGKAITPTPPGPYPLNFYATGMYDSFYNSLTVRYLDQLIDSKGNIANFVCVASVSLDSSVNTAHCVVYQTNNPALPLNKELDFYSKAHFQDASNKILILATSSDANFVSHESFEYLVPSQNSN